MPGKFVSESELKSFIDELASLYEVFAPIKKRGDYVFKQVFDCKEVDLEYTTTILPPKKYLLPPTEALMKLKPSGEADVIEPKTNVRVLFGVHSCDLHGLMILDKVFIDHFKLPQYVERRKNLLTIALTCLNPSTTCFCASMGTGPSPHQGYDLLITKIKDGFLIEFGSKKGNDLISLVQGGRKCIENDYRQKSALISEAEKMCRKEIKNVAELPELFERTIDHEVWERLGDIDLACCQCVMSCPTCYCFDIKDKLSLNTNESIRYKEWDACITLEFSEVALGGNFRRARSARVRQFIGHNLGWGGSTQYPDLKGKIKCVGCGRCIKVCPVHIDLTEVVKELRGEKGA